MFSPEFSGVRRHRLQYLHRYREMFAHFVSSFRFVVKYWKKRKEKENERLNIRSRRCHYRSAHGSAHYFDFACSAGHSTYDLFATFQTVFSALLAAVSVSRADSIESIPKMNPFRMLINWSGAAKIVALFRPTFMCGEVVFVNSICMRWKGRAAQVNIHKSSRDEDWPLKIRLLLFFASGNWATSFALISAITMNYGKLSARKNWTH